MSEIIIGVLSGIGVSVLFLFIAAPVFVAFGLFVNKPGQQIRSPLHFFTFIEQGEVKFVVRGENVVRGIMNTSGKRFAKVGTNKEESYWQIVPGEPENPAKYVTPFLRVWAYYVYFFTGAVFTGIYPFQRVREYKLGRTDVERTEEELEAGKAEDNLRLVVKEDFSDHYRLRLFLFYIHVIGAETKDKIPVDMLFALECEVSNPFRAAFGVDRWDSALTNFGTDQLTQMTRTMTLDQILTAENKAEAAKLKKVLVNQKHTNNEFGINIRGARFLKTDPRVTPEELKKLRAEALALQEAKATRIDGKARADNLRELNKANEEGGVYALATLDAETRVRAAAAAGAKGIVIMGAQQAVDPIHAAQLRALEEKGNDK